MKRNIRPTRNYLVVVLAGGLLLLSSGCGFFENAGTITGTVRYKGEPLPEGSVSFVNDKGKVVTATIDQSGRYAASHVPTGSAKVTVQVVRADGPPPVSFGATPKSVQGTAAVFKIPSRYGVPATSGLKWEVAKGKQQFDIDLTE
ncbi:MAG TPA: carboxypeptidase-like regulatory domain-containing protein [Gemmataceae bacterium]|nr:carboxypeptidase-like regulatory domain-containing protein [Gemmataceae bacterium]